MDIRVKKIKEIIETRNTTQKDFAKELDMHPAYLSRIMTGNIVASDKVMRKIAKKYEIPAYKLIDDAIETIKDEEKENLTRTICHTLLDNILDYGLNEENKDSFYENVKNILVDIETIFNCKVVLKALLENNDSVLHKMLETKSNLLNKLK